LSDKILSLFQRMRYEVKTLNHDGLEKGLDLRHVVKGQVTLYLDCFSGVFYIIYNGDYMNYTNYLLL